MAEIETFDAIQRTSGGKGSARAARRDGQVPAVVYGNNEEPLMVTITGRALVQRLHQPGFFTQLIDLKVAGTSHRVLPRDIQYHPVTDVPLHVDFLRFSAQREITAAVPVSFINDPESPGLKRGGVLNVVRFEVEVSCRADNIPQNFDIDLTGLDIGDSIHASMIALPENVTFTITDRDFTIATIAAPTVVEEETTTAVAEGAEGEGAEGADEATAGGGDSDGEKSDG